MNIRITLLKGLRDLWVHRVRTVGTLVILSLGGFAIGTMAVSLALIQTGMDRGYKESNPANIVMRAPAAQSDAEYRRVAGLIASNSGIRDFVRRPEISGRLRRSGADWQTLLLFPMDFSVPAAVDRVTVDSGTLTAGGVACERAALGFLNISQGEQIEINIPGMPIQEYPVTATVHAPGLAPAWMERTGYIFIDRASPIWKALPIREDIWRIRVRDNVSPARTAEQLSDLLSRQGITPVIWQAPEVVRHPHASQMDTLLLMLESFSVLCFLLSLTLGAVQINRTLGAQTRQIAIQRALGCSNKRLWVSSLLSIGIMALAALGISFPLSRITGRAYAGFALRLLNFNVVTTGIPAWVYGLFILTGIFLPLLAAWVPVRKAIRRTIREGLQEQGVSDTARPTRTMPLPLGIRARYAVRTAARKPLRALFTLCLLAVGGACFLTAANIQASMDATVQKQFSGIVYDTLIVLTRGLDGETIASLQSLEGIKGLEGWSAGYCAVRKGEHGWTGTMRVYSIPENSRMKRPPAATQGGWLPPGPGNAVVANQVAAQAMGYPRVGETVLIQQGNVRRELVLVGIVTELMNPPVLYIQGEPGALANVLVVAARERDTQSVARLERDLENRLAPGVQVQMTMPTRVFKQAVIDHLWVLSAFLLFVSLLVFVVAGLSLSSSLALTVSERSREWSVLRSIGAGPRSIYAILLWESFAYGVSSALLGFVSSIPVGYALSRFFGESFFYAPLVFGLSLPGLALWGLLLLILCIISSLFPAMRIIAQPVVDGLKYE